MRREIVETDEALKDVIEIAEYFAENTSLDASDGFIAAAKQAFRDLAEMPGVGVLRDYGNNSNVGMRMWPFPRYRKYLIFYRVTEKEVIILRVVHGARDLQTLFGPKEDED